MTFLLIIAIFLLFGITVFVHEFGHFIAARKCGFIVDTFSIGFGPAIWKTKKNGILYKIGIIPFGGYVSIPQLDPEGMEKVQGESGEDVRELPDIAPWKKIVVAVAGPLGNIILATILAWAIYLIPSSDNTELNVAKIGQINHESAVYKQGLRQGDQVIAVNGKSIKSWYDLSVEALLTSGNGDAELTVKDGNETKLIKTPLQNPETHEDVIPGVMPAIPCILGLVNPGSPADKAGIKAEDRLVEFDGVEIHDWAQFTDLVQTFSNKTVSATLERDGEMVKVEVTPEYSEEYGRVLLGIQLGGGFMPWMSEKEPWAQIKSDSSSIFRLLGALINPAESKQAAGGLGGPLSIFIMIFASLKTGILNTMGLIRFLNINLAILNLLPLPVLDGGHICFALWEVITRKKVHPKVVAGLVNAFAILLIGAMLLLTFRDADRQWKISKLFKKAPTVELIENPAEVEK